MFWKKNNEVMVQKGLEALQKRDYSTAAKQFSEANKNGSAEGSYLLGKMYGNGLYYNYDAEKEYTFTKQAAEQGYAPAQRHLATMYHDGFYHFVKRDLDECCNYLASAIDQEEPLAFAYAHLYGVLEFEKSKIKAMDLFQEFMETGDIDCIDACMEISTLYLENNEEKNHFDCFNMISSFDPCCYHLGRGVSLILSEETEEEGKKELQKAMDKNMPDAFYIMGKCYLANGSRKEGETFLKKAADMGMNEAKFELINLKAERGEFENIFEELKKLADWGLPEAMIKYGNVLIKSNPDLALEYLRKAEILEDPEAYIALGHFYRQGDGDRAPDFSRSFEYYLKAVNRNSIEAHIFIAEMYITGSGTPQNFYAAFGHLLYAAEHNNPTALARIGYHLAHGFGCVKNEKLSSEYYEKAIAAGSAEAMMEFSKKLMGSEDPKEKEYGISLLEKAAELEYGEALFLLGYSYYSGKFHQVDREKSSMYFYQAIEEGNINAAGFLGIQLLNGDGVEKDETMALHLLTKAAAENIPEAMFEIGKYGLRQKNYVDAYNFLYGALKLGYPPAFEEVAKMYRDGLGVKKDKEKAEQYFEIFQEIR